MREVVQVIQCFHHSLYNGDHQRWLWNSSRLSLRQYGAAEIWSLSHYLLNDGGRHVLACRVGGEVVEQQRNLLHVQLSTINPSKSSRMFNYW